MLFSLFWHGWGSVGIEWCHVPFHHPIEILQMQWQHWGYFSYFSWLLAINLRDPTKQMSFTPRWPLYRPFLKPAMETIGLSQKNFKTFASLHHMGSIKTLFVVRLSPWGVCLTHVVPTLLVSESYTGMFSERTLQWENSTQQWLRWENNRVHWFTARCVSARCRDKTAPILPSPTPLKQKRTL